MEKEGSSGSVFNPSHSLLPHHNNLTIPLLSTDYYSSVGIPPLDAEDDTTTTNGGGGGGGGGRRRRRRRETVSDRARCLLTLMPNKRRRFKTADLLEEAFNYLHFLQAQLRALHSMPPLISSSSAPLVSASSHFGVLGLLNSQQLLQLLLHSPSIHSNLSSLRLFVSSLHPLSPFHPPPPP